MKPTSPQRLVRTGSRHLALALVSLLAAASAQAAILYWDGTSPLETPGFGTANGIWGSNAYWTTSTNGSSTPGTTATTTADTLNFGNASTGLLAGTITVGTVSAGDLTFAAASGTIVLSGGTITLAAAETLTVDNATDTIGSILAGAATSLTKLGSGTLVLSGANTYTGTTTVSAGILNIQHATALGTAASGTSVATGAALQIQNGITVGNEALTLGGDGIGSTGALRNISGNNFWQGTVTLAGATTLQSDAGTLTFDTAAISITGSNNLTIQGAGGVTISGGTTGIDIGTGSLTKNNAGTLTLTGPSSYSGATLINGGVVNIRNAYSLGTAAGGVTVAAGAALQIQGGITVGGEALSLSGTGISNDGALRNMSGANTWQGAVTLAGATRINSDAGSLTFDTAANSITGTQNLTLGGAAGGSVNGTITTGTGTLTKDGAGTWTLAGANTYSGLTTITNGTLLFGKRAALYTDAAVNWTTSNLSVASASILGIGLGDHGSGYFDATDLATLLDGAHLGASTASTGLKTGSVLGLDTTNATSGTFTYNTAIANTGNALNLAKLGAGILTLSASNTYTGTTNLSVGTLKAGILGTATGGAFGTNSAVTMATGTTLDITDFNTWIGSLTGNGSITLGAAILTVGGNNTSPAAYAGAINGGGGLTKIGSGTLTLSGTNGYTGATTLNEGTLSVSATGNLGGTNSLVFDGGTLQVTGTSLTTFGTHTPTFNPGKTAVFDISTSNNIFTASQILNQGSGGLTKSGSGTLKLSGSNTFNGQLTVQNGTLSVATINNDSTDGPLGNNALAVILGNAGSQNGTLQYTGGGTAASTKKFTLATGGSGTFQVDTAGTILTLSGAIDGSGNLLKSGAGKLILSGSISYTGTTTVNAGSIGLGASDLMPATTNLVVRANPGTVVFDLGGFNQTVASITMSAQSGGDSASINTGTGTLTVNGNISLPTTNNFWPTITNTISGNLALGGGTRSIDTGGNSPSQITAVISNGGITKLGSAWLLLTGANTYNLGTTLSAGYVSMGIDPVGSVGSITNSAIGTGTLTFNGGGISSNSITARTILNPITFSGPGLFGDGTNLGQLTFSANADLGGSARTLTVAANTTAQLDGIISNGGIAKSGTGTLLLANATNNYAGGTTVNTGTLKLGVANALQGAVTLFANPGTVTLDLNGLNTTISTLSIGAQSGSDGPVTVNTGAGILTLGGDFTFTGTTNNPVGGIINGNLSLGSATRQFLMNAHSTNAANVNGDIYIPAIISGNSGVGLTVGGSSATGVLTLSGANTYTGNTTLANAILRVGGAENAGVAGPLGHPATPAGSIIFNGGILQYSSGNQFDYSSRFSTAASQQYKADTNGQSVIWASGLTSSAGTLTKSGNGTLELSGTNTYSGTTTVSAGTLVLSGNNSGSISLVTIALGGIGQFNSLNSIPGSGRSVTDTGTLVFGPAFGVANIPAGLARITTGSSGVIAIDNYLGTNFDLNAAGLTAASLGSLASATYTGTLTPQGGVYRLGGGGGTLTLGNVNALTGANAAVINNNVILAALNNHTGTTTINASATLTLGTGVTGQNGSVGGNISNSGTLVINDFDAQTYGGVISGTGPLTKTAAGAFTFSSPQTYTGTTTVNAGTLLLAGGNHTLAVNKALVVNTGGTLDLGSNNQYVGQFSGSGGGVTGSGSLTTSLTGAGSYAGSLGGSVNLVKVGTQTLTLTSDSTTSGTLKVLGGGLALKDSGVLSNATGALTINGATVTIDNTGTADNSNRVNDSKSITLNGGTLIFSGRASTNSAETLGAVTANSGSSIMSALIGTSGSAQLTMTSLTRTPGASIFFNQGMTSFGSAGNSSRILANTTNTQLTGNLAPINGVVPGAFFMVNTDNYFFVDYSPTLGFKQLASTTNNFITAGASDNVRDVSGVVGADKTINSFAQGTLTFTNGTSTGGTDLLTLGSGMAILATNTWGTTSARGRITSGTNELFLFKRDANVTPDPVVNSVIVDKNGSTALNPTDKVSLIVHAQRQDRGYYLHLTAPNLYSGGTFVDVGPLNVAAAGLSLDATSAGIVTIPAGGLTLNNNTLVEMTGFQGQIDPTNAVTINGGGQLHLMGTNTLADITFNSNGGTVVPAVIPYNTITAGSNNNLASYGTKTGTLVITGNITSTPTNVAVTPLIDSGTLDLNGTSTHDIRVSAQPDGNFVNNLTPLNGLAISSVIQNGGFTKKGDGVLNLTGSNTFTGDLAVQEGVVNVATFNETSASGPLGKSTNAVALGGSGGKTGAIEYSGGSSTSTRLFTLATGGTGGFQVDAAATTLTLSGQIDGSGGLAKTGAGTLTLSSAKTYSGNTTVKAGTLKLDGAGSIANSPSIIVGDTAGSAAVLDVSTKTGGFTVGSTQTLGGCGVINGAVNVSGVLSPGASIETLASGALTLNTGSTFAYEMNSSVAATVGADLLKAGGGLNLNGTVTLSLTDIAATPISFTIGTTFSLINYTGVWNSGLFTIGGAARIDEAEFFAGNNTWQIDYNATSGGSNFSSEQVPGHFVNLTATGGLVDAPKMVVLDPNQVNIPNSGAQAFGTVAVGSSLSLTLTIKNTGKADLTLDSIYLDGSNSSEFTVTTAPTSPVAWATGGNTTTFTVKFSPTGAGARQAILHIPNNDTTTFDINLSGTSTNPYQDWIDGYTDLMLADRVPGADPDKDGSNNLAEFAFNGVPNNPAKKGLFFTQLKDNGDGDTLKELTFTCAVRRSTSVAFPASGVQTATIDGVTYTIEANPVLTGTWSSAVSYAGKSNTPPAGSNLPDLTGTAWEYCIFSAFNGLGGKGFIRAKVALP